MSRSIESNSSTSTTRTAMIANRTAMNAASCIRTGTMGAGLRC